MNEKVLYSPELLMQAQVAAGLTEVLKQVADCSHNSGVQISMEKAIVSLLAPFQPEENVKAKTSGEAGTVGNGQATAGPKDDNVYIHFKGARATGKTNLAFRVQRALLDQGFNVDFDEDATGDVLTVVSPAEVIKADNAGSAGSDPRLDPNWCENCQEVHPEPSRGEVRELAGLLSILSLLGSRKPKA